MGRMSMPKADIEVLQSWGNNDKDINQIGYAARANITKYTVLNDDDTERRITKSEAIEILGRETWLSGLHRSAFHRTAVREGKNGIKVFFDSSKIWK